MHELRRARNHAQRRRDELQVEGRLLFHEMRRVVLLASQRNAFVGQHALQRQTVLWLIVHQHAVEVEQHRFRHSVSWSHANMFGQQERRACSLTTKPRCDRPGSIASAFRAAPTRSTTWRHAAAGAKMRSAAPATPRYGTLSAARPAK